MFINVRTRVVCIGGVGIVGNFEGRGKRGEGGEEEEGREWVCGIGGNFVGGAGLVVGGLIVVFLDGYVLDWESFLGRLIRESIA